MVKEKKNNTVFVGLSGGVDSAVSALLLKQAGYNVIGVFIKVWDPSESAQGKARGRLCSWRVERRSAFAVAATLDIPLYTLDLSAEYKQAVIDYLLAEYQVGRTPNPDVVCNQKIKFGAFADKAFELGADFVATGHYCQIKNLKLKIKNENQLQTSLKMVGHGSGFLNLFGVDQQPVLATAVDSNKDQSYFLWAIKPDLLAKILFPIGHLTKTAVRQLAKKYQLPNADKKDSQGLCFVGDFDFKEFLKEELGEKPGSVLNSAGETIGQHLGTHFYTIGERHSFTITSDDRSGEAWYIIAKDSLANTLTVAHEVKTIGNPIATEILKLKNTNWFFEPTQAKIYQARLRYRAPLSPCQLQKNKNNDWDLKFLTPVTSPALGQSVVVYDNELVVGGGVIS
ncbi:MAG: tRNA 2-thiouridine(34) synthase MnmA [Candidatus Vogelbacteria bacterium CG22_combo_CG10-13_8_21_14_all_37_9]|uniref:tRNA-specific 2-thiouridylase MnmA n=1 Tax=Candidatus Vogelbacteria bacterium CG22_combo_CG10-13_8_21_14_all_37_9 TaxID=1975046 RepID=A0A2H0BKP6_9BACT|nr:MAG: tRNA 2-thiouridine(34) synthase MnmA [bacterium CG10_37_50]PIP58242.1 MAG: tRNA 2-thiouridine(34) synthase MnmA [Candidatus Vogelbacteria bacterium CG22_combo_CG10-13_8_21_14_all_37_9]